MTMIRAIKKSIERVFRIRIYRSLPHGIDILADIRRLLPNQKIKIVFDVGANIGQSVNAYVKEFPDAVFYCFEPAKENFDALTWNTAKRRNINCYNFAFSNTCSRGKIILEGPPDMYHLAESSQAINHGWKHADVEVKTVDDFCDRENIKSISFLKIDTEGNDLRVLQGAEKLLLHQQIDIIQVETGMNPMNTRHVEFNTIKSFLEKIQYYLFGIYEQVDEWPSSCPNLRRVNAVYVSKNVITGNKKK